jgi:hypothetical protein
MATQLITYAVRNQADEAETEAWECQASSAKEAAHQYLAEFWSAEQYPEGHPKAGRWWSPTYTGDIDGADLEILVVFPDAG